MLEDLISHIDKWRRLGTQKCSDGSEIIGHTPRKFPQAYLHAIFAAKDPGDWQSYLSPLPGALESLYWRCNGLRLFSELSIYGICRDYHRDSSAAFQPFDLLSHHREQIAARQLGERVLFFGGYRSDGSSVAVGYGSAAVFAFRRNLDKPVFEWPDVPTFLTAEFGRLEAIHDQDGYPIASLIPSKPA